MTDSLTVYGFGSFFNGAAQPRDIDLLLVHRSVDLHSCKFAVNCKEKIKSALPSADIVMLSQAEANGVNFVERASARILSDLHSDDLEAGVRALVDRLGSAEFR